MIIFEAEYHFKKSYIYRDYIFDILQESCKIETFTEIELQGPTTLYGRLTEVITAYRKRLFPVFKAINKLT
jgi:hypothetical protein